MYPQQGVARMPISGRLSTAEVLYYGMVLVLPFDQASMVSGFAPAKWFGLCFMMAALADWRKFFGKVPPALVSLLIVVVIGTVVDLTRYTGQWTAGMFNDFGRMFQMWVLTVATYNLAINNRFATVVGVFYVAALIETIFQFFDLGGELTRASEIMVEGVSTIRSATLGMDANFLSVFVCVSVLYGVGRLLSRNRTRLLYQILFLAGSCMGFIGMLKASSRGAFVALAGALLSLAWTSKGQGRRMTLLLSVGIVAVAMFSFAKHDILLESRFRKSMETRDTAGRIEILEAGLGIIRGSPIWGYGNRMYMFTLSKASGHGESICGTHNTYLTMVLATGLGGTIFFLHFFLRALKSAWVRRTEENGCIVFSWCVLMCFGALTLNLETVKWFWVAMALALASEGALPRYRAPAWP